MGRMEGRSRTAGPNIDAGNPMFSKTKGWFERTKSVNVQSGTGSRCALVTAEEE